MALVLGCACAPAWATEPAGTTNLSIQNPGFELPVIESNKAYLASPGEGWTSMGSPALHRKAAYKNYLPPEQFAAVEGGQFLNARGATVSQTLAATYTAGMRYTLTCLVGKTAMWPCTGYAVQLKRGDVIVAEIATKTMSATGTAPPPSGTTLDLVPLRYQAVAADHGHPITIALSGQGDALFDDVRLSERDASGEATVLIPIAANGNDEQAFTLRQYLLMSTPCDVTIVETPAEFPPTGTGIVLNIESEIPGLSARPTALQGYRIAAQGNRVTLSARTSRGLTYAVYGLLEDHLGARFFAPDCRVTPERPTFALPDFDEVREPAFQVRSMFGSGGAWEIRNRGGGLPADILVANHNFYQYAPPDQYLAPHPEWYPLIGGVRQQHWLQGLCYSNPELARQMASNMVAEIRSSNLPAGVPIRIGQGDGFIACGCEVCRAVAVENESEAGPVILLLNRILAAMASEFPEHPLITFAYGDTIRMPKVVQPHTNLWINIVSSSVGGGGWGPGQGGDMINAIRDNPQNAVYQQAIEDWTDVAPGRVAIWHWSTDFVDHSVEWPNLFTMADNIRLWREQQVAAVALQTTGGEGNWGWLKHWVWLKLMWNPDADVEALVREFLSGYYGPAAAPILWEYHQYVEQVRLESGFGANACDGGQANAMTILNGLFPLAKLDDMDALLEQATQAAATEEDPVYARRVQHARAYSVDQLKIVDAAGVQPYPGGHFYPPETVTLARIQDPRDGSFWMVPGNTPDMPARVERRDESLKVGGDREWGAGFINRFWYQRGVGGKLARIESQALAVEVCPNLVGTITSVIHKPTGKELLAGRFPLYEWPSGMQSMECFLPATAPSRLVMEQWIQTDVWYYQEDRQRYCRTIELAEDAPEMRIAREFTGNAPGMPDPSSFPSIWTFQAPELATASVTVTVNGERKALILVREKGSTEILLDQPADLAVVDLDRGDGLLVTLTTPVAGWSAVTVTTDPDRKAVSVALKGIPLAMIPEGNGYNLPGAVLRARMTGEVAVVTWRGVDMTWSQPDTNSFSYTYNNGDTANFTGAGVGNITIAPGGVAPAAINLTGGYHYQFNIGEDNALGTGPISIGYQCADTFNNTKGSELTLANDITLPSGGWLWLAGGAYRLTGTVTGPNGGNPIVFVGEPGNTVTLENGVAGAGTQFDLGYNSGEKFRINGASTASCRQTRQAVWVQIGANNVFGPAGTQVMTGENPTFEAVGGPRTLSNNFGNRGMSVLGAHDLTLNGYFGVNESRYNLTKLGTATLILGADNVAGGWAQTIRICEGAVRLAHPNARGACGVQFSGGVLELGAGDFTLATNISPQSSASVGWVTDGAYGGSGGFSAYGANRSVNLGGAGAPVTWGAGGFVPAGQALIFGSSKSDARLDFKNPINLGGAVRTIRVDDNPNSSADRAVLSGALSGTTGNGLAKTGVGLLLLNATNTYSGVTTVTAGSLGGTGSLAGGLVFESAAAYHADLGASAAATETLTVGGSLTLNDNTLMVQGPAVLETGSDYLVMAVSGTVAGSFYPTPTWVGPVPEHGTNFTVVTDAGAKQVRLHYAPGGPMVVCVTFDAQGGTELSPVATFRAVGAPYGSLATTTRAGHTFAGWWSAAGGGTEVTAATTVSATLDHTLYARWTPHTYTVTYVANGATSGAAPAPQVKTHGVDLPAETNYGNLARTGCTFTGWNTAANGSGTDYPVGRLYAVDASVTLYAKWAPLTYAVTYNANGATSGTVPAAQVKTYGVALTLAANLGGLSKPEYVFGGWSTAADGSGAYYAAGATYSADAAVTLYVKWMAGTITLNNGAGALARSRSAWLQGNLAISTGPTAATRIYWGPTDGGTAMPVWSSVIDLGVLPAGPLSGRVQGLTPNTTYYYRCYATNTAVDAWAAYSTNFTTLPDEPMLATASAGSPASAFSFSWDGETGRTYSAQFSTNLLNTNGWTALVPYTNMPGVDGVMNAVDANASGFASRFYRAQVNLRDYLCVDLSGGTGAVSYPVTYYRTVDDVPGGPNSDAYKTTNLLLRLIPQGRFIMGSPSNELGRAPGETQHAVTLTRDFYTGVFEVTQRQWELVMGSRPSYFTNTDYYASRPVEKVSYYDIRENPDNSDDPAVNWPSNSAVNAASFMGKLRTKTGIATFDLPTESQWEYACRANTATALNSGKNLTTDDTNSCPNMTEVGRYRYNGGADSSRGGAPTGGTAQVGSYLPNAWGLYDMHGNVAEWCLDWYGTYPGTVTDPRGAGAAPYWICVFRGGYWSKYAPYCRSAARDGFDPDYRSPYFGFRVCCVPPPSSQP